MSQITHQAIVMTEYGGPEVLQIASVASLPLTAGQVRVRHTRIGVNFHDIYVRSGLYKTLALPGTPGIEAVGVVAEVGEGVTRFRPGDRVCYVSGAYAIYAAERVIAGDELIAVPDDLSDALVASSLLRGLTADVLLHRVARVSQGSRILVQAAGGGMGQILSQWATQLGAMVIGTAGSDATAKKADQAGCVEVIRYRGVGAQDVAVRVQQLTGGEGVDVAYDGVGKDSFDGSVASLGIGGQLVMYGQSSGPVPPLEIARLAAKSNSVCRPMVFHFVKKPRERDAMAARLFEALRKKHFRMGEPQEFALADAAQAHRQLEAHGAQQPILLVP
ncbi:MULTISPECIES: quinone oxidoreductase family protein [Comamonas]|uniref:quinone oxidoreductase family protein n=1 Tax=Comamonas TaxID=283 RepID=UPI00050E34ED|nr:MULTISPECIES: quinone oxidoreductase [Comamonas]KGG91986.1 alcohol dehydrogenase [Comamonas thiooxydans]KGG98304.1 alcohol dehydrogenase [Comamonas thiooxydans]KGH04086.1 alcohol dehydrogenase [Comamonas thiooxydans]KGH12206.1 alcohol dehydrogenase [Comamonas thiooxydans]TZG08821.1 quinone oxidoreductase [Comamonas thiooxydans]